jgi:hypothetical protein
MIIVMLMISSNQQIDSVPEFGANMAQVTLGKFFSGVPKFDGEGANHVTENELKFHVECSLKKPRHS